MLVRNILENWAVKQRWSNEEEEIRNTNPRLRKSDVRAGEDVMSTSPGHSILSQCNTPVSLYKRYSDVTLVSKFIYTFVALKSMFHYKTKGCVLS